MMFKKAQYPSFAEKDRSWVVPTIIIGLLILTIVISIFQAQSSIKACNDAACFIQEANNCNPAYFESNDNGTITKHKTSGCVYTRSILAVSASEPDSVRQLFSGKSMSCAYPKGQFNEDLVNSISLGLDTCSGDLYTAINDLVSAQQQLGLI